MTDTTLVECKNSSFPDYCTLQVLFLNSKMMKMLAKIRILHNERKKVFIMNHLQVTPCSKQDVFKPLNYKLAFTL